MPPAIQSQRLSDLTPIPLGSDQADTIFTQITEVLFATDEHIYAVLDAACLDGLPALLEAEKLQHLCLFRGELAQEAADVAPYLVALSRDCRLLRSLLTSEGKTRASPGAYWAAQAGVFINSPLSLEALHRHLRRFMRVSDAHGAAYFFRFWEPACANGYFSGLADRPAKVSRWFCPHDASEQIHALWIPLRDTNQQECFVRLTPGEGLLQFPTDPGAFQLDPQDIEVFRLIRWQKDVQTVAQNLQDMFSTKTEALPQGALPALCDQTMRRMMPLGFAQMEMLQMFCAWELHYGPKFETRDPSGALQHTLQDSRPAEVRFSQLKEQMSTFEAQL